MGEECDPAAKLWMKNGEAAFPELKDEPDAEEHPRRQISPEEENHEEEERRDARVRQEHEICPEYSRDRPARADVGDARACGVRKLKRDEGLGERGCETCPEVPEEEADPAERILNVVAEDPEEEHVSADVKPARVHEHRREDAVVPGEVIGRHEAWIARAGKRAGVVAVMQHLLVHARLPLPVPHGNVGGDQPDRDDREAPRRDVVLERYHGAWRLRHQRMTRAISAFWA